MKHDKFYLLGTVLLVAIICAEHAVANSMSIAVQPTILQLNPVTAAVPKDDDQEEPDEGYECQLFYPYCEAL